MLMRIIRIQGPGSNDGIKCDMAPRSPGLPNTYHMGAVPRPGSARRARAHLHVPLKEFYKPKKVLNSADSSTQGKKYLTSKLFLDIISQCLKN